MAGDTFNPRVDRFLNSAAFVQPVGQLGNAPRMNPDVRGFWNLNENISLAKTITVNSQFSMDVRVEAFNIFNRVVFATPTQPSTGGAAFTNLSSPTFGVVSSQSNTPRQMQIGLKLYW
jgi:hypothetical protein